MKLQTLGRLIETIIKLVSRGHHVVLVSSGAGGCGRIKLGLKERPTTLAGKQAVAAAGQSYLMRLYEDLFEISSGEMQQRVAQLLINRRDFNHKPSFENIRNTINELLALGVIPIINENDAVQPVTGQHDKFGDNDQLAALTAINLEADWLFLLTDVDYVYTANPSEDPTAEPIREVRSLDELQQKGVSTAIKNSQKWGTGGMASKIVSARQACCAGVRTVLVNGKEPERIVPFIDCYADGDKDSQTSPSATDVPVGTYFHAMQSVSTLCENRRWILALPVMGRIVVNVGCAKAMFRKSSLLAAGIVQIEGDFTENDCVQIMVAGSPELPAAPASVPEPEEVVVEEEERKLEAPKAEAQKAARKPKVAAAAEQPDVTLVAQGLTNFSSEDLQRIKGMKSADFERALGYKPTDAEVCHRYNVILIGQVEDIGKGASLAVPVGGVSSTSVGNPAAQPAAAAV